MRSPLSSSTNSSRESLPATIAGFMHVGPHPHRLDGTLGTSQSSAPFRNRSEALDTASASQSLEQAKVPRAVLSESPPKARPERSERRTHPCGRRISGSRKRGIVVAGWTTSRADSPRKCGCPFPRNGGNPESPNPCICRFRKSSTEQITSSNLRSSFGSCAFTQNGAWRRRNRRRILGCEG